MTSHSFNKSILLSECGAIARELTFKIGDLTFYHVNQIRLIHVKNKMAYFQTLVSYLGSSLCTD